VEARNVRYRWILFDNTLIPFHLSVLHLLSPFRRPEYSGSGSPDSTLYSPMSSAGDDLSPSPSSSDHAVMYIDILPEGSPEPSPSSSSPWAATGNIVRTPDYPRPLRSISPTVSFMSSVPIVAQSRFTVYSEDLILHAETVPLVPVLDHAPGGPGLLYSTPLVPQFWAVILESPGTYPRPIYFS
jgi:transcriptional enhancer factor